MATCISVFPPDRTGDIHDVYEVRFYEHTIQTLVTNSPASVNHWISQTERPLSTLHPVLVGLDAEWRPNYQRGSVQNPVATLQLCVGNRCMIFQILQCSSPSIPESLINFLSNPSYKFVGLAIQDDVEKLRRDYNLEVSRTGDLRMLAADAYGMRELNFAGLATLSNMILGKVVSKQINVRRSNWDDMFLTPEQVEYASIDAFVSYEIGRVLSLD